MALILLKKNGRTLRTFPRALEIRRKEENKMMKNLKRLLFITALVAGISISAFAKKEDKKPPPKEKPPTIEIEPKKKPKEEKPKEEKPKDDKKPQAMVFKGKYELSFV